MLRIVTPPANALSRAIQVASSGVHPWPAKVAYLLDDGKAVKIIGETLEFGYIISTDQGAIFRSRGTVEKKLPQAPPQRTHFSV